MNESLLQKDCLLMYRSSSAGISEKNGYNSAYSCNDMTVDMQHMDRFQILSPNMMRESIDERATGTFVNTATSAQKFDSSNLECSKVIAEL